MTTNKNIKIIAFDADDTLWDCQSYFDKVTDMMCEMVSKWCTPEEAREELVNTERKNLGTTGYGCKAYILSVMETAILLSNNEISTKDIMRLIHAANDLIMLPATPLPQVEPTLKALDSYFKIIFTKGDNLEQLKKVERSGLAAYFDDVVVTANKSEKEFSELCARYEVKPEELMMVGNSFKSDIAPALSIGAWGVYIPYLVSWEIEKTEEFTHPRCEKILHFGDLLRLI